MTKPKTKPQKATKKTPKPKTTWKTVKPPKPATIAMPIIDRSSDDVPPKERREWKTLFLATLRKTMSVTAAAKSARINRQYVYKVRDEEKEFAEAWADAEAEAIETAEAEGYRRAVKGVKKPVFQNGILVGTITEYSDGLLQFYLKAHKPKVYRESIEHKHDGTVNVNHQVNELMEKVYGDAPNGAAQSPAEPTKSV